MHRDKNGDIRLTKQEEEFLLDLLNETGMELWGGSCSNRILVSYDGIRFCEYDNPLHGKEYKTIAGAIRALEKEESN